MKQACAAEIAVRYAALKCKQNKRYRTSARLTKHVTSFSYYAAPSYGGGPHNKKNFYKYWWSEELTILKQNSIDTNRIWKAAGKPRYGRR